MSIVALVSIVAATSSDQESACEPDLHRICGNEKFPTDTPELYQARMCLRANIDSIDPSCTNYLTVMNPSIVEPCFDEINQNCKNVPAGDSRVHHCLESTVTKFSPKCAASIRREIEQTNVPNKDMYMLKAVSKNPALAPLKNIFQHIRNELEILQQMTVDLMNGGDVVRIEEASLPSGSSSSDSSTHFSSSSYYSYDYASTSSSSISSSSSSFSGTTRSRVSEAPDDRRRALRRV